MVSGGLGATLDDLDVFRLCGGSRLLVSCGGHGLTILVDVLLKVIEMEEGSIHGKDEQSFLLCTICSSVQCLS